MTRHPLLCELQQTYDRIVARDSPVPAESETSAYFLSDNILDARTDGRELRGIPLCGHGGAIIGTRPGIDRIGA